LADEIRNEWYRRRVAAIHEVVTAYDVLRQNGVSFDQAADDRAEQISCPFHGSDNKPSARIYPAENDGHSHVWCYVCQEAGWDAIGLWRKFNNDLTFSQALSSLERAYSLPTLEPPKDFSADAKPDEDDEARARFKQYYTSCESRLFNQKDVYKRLDDMVGYLSAGSVLDKVRFRVDSNLWSPDKGIQVLEQLLDKIREKVSQCPEG
jgi:hypothetical protein